MGEIMITKMELTEYFKKCIKLITFVDLPISRKFFLFSIGVAFWFLVMFIVSIATNMNIKAKTNKIINHVMPYDRTTQKITRQNHTKNHQETPELERRCI
jgi:type II secretory pathway component PulC